MPLLVNILEIGWIAIVTLFIVALIFRSEKLFRVTLNCFIALLIFMAVSMIAYCVYMEYMKITAFVAGY